MLKRIDFNSLTAILVVGLFFRLLSAIFSAGYGMHDDHFLIIEAASSWADGYDYNGWLPWSENNRGGAEGHSFTYVGLNYIYFELAKFFGILDPMWQMFLNRLVHAFFSLLIVFFGYKITEKISNKNNAIIVGWIISLLWIMPFLSVRNLVEMTSIPFLMWGVWLLVRDRGKKDFLWAGMMIGMAVSFRYQIGIFAVGAAAVYFFRKEWKAFLNLCIGVLLTFCLTQGVVDFVIWGKPFTEFIAYFTYNVNEGTGYMVNSNYFMYFYVLFGVLLFPLGILALFGFFKSIKSNLLLFIPTFAFLIFHTLYPNRQERFILTIFPFVVILSVIGIEYLRKTTFWNKAWRWSWIGFWILNIPLLLFFSFTSSKVSRVEAMYSLYGNGMEKEAILLEASSGAKISMLPRYYSSSWHSSTYERGDSKLPLNVVSGIEMDYIFFIGDEDLAKRKKQYEVIYPRMRLIKKCQPSSIDRLLHTLNPRNSNEYIEVWKTK